MVFMLLGCTAAIKESELFDHDSVYQDFGHLWFSWYGHKSIDADDVKNSRADKWWGITKTYPPTEIRE